MVNLIDKNDIRNKNPWWIDHKINILEPRLIHRDLYFVLKKDLKLPMILNIIGLRRVGKSTIVKQLIANLLNKKENPINIFYYLFDEYNQVNTTKVLEEVLNYYLNEILEKKLFEIKKRVYIFLDEIQYIAGWQAVLKKYYDLSNKKIKFIITGSQSVLLKKKSAETLSGRIFDYYLPPLSFREFLEIKKTKIDISKINRANIFTLDKFFKKIESLNYQSGQKLSELAQEYVLTGQFPECLEIVDEKMKNVYLKESVVGKIIEDILTIYDIDKTENFKILTHYLLKNSGNLIELKNISEQIGLSFISLDKYLDFLKSGYLVKLLYKKHRSSIKQGRILKKIYATSSNFTSALEGYQKKDLKKFPQVFGHIIETAIFNFLEINYSGNSLISRVSFWRRGEKEIDFLISDNQKEIALEVKFTQRISNKELKTLINYVQEKKTRLAIVVTKNKIDKKKINKQTTLYYIPYYLFLLLVKNS